MRWRRQGDHHLRIRSDVQLAGRVWSAPHGALPKLGETAKGKNPDGRRLLPVTAPKRPGRKGGALFTTGGTITWPRRDASGLGGRFTEGVD